MNVPTFRRRADGRWVVHLVDDDGRDVELVLAPDVRDEAQAKRAFADLRRVTPRVPKKS